MRGLVGLEFRIKADDKKIYSTKLTMLTNQRTRGLDPAPFGLTDDKNEL